MIFLVLLASPYVFPGSAWFSPCYPCVCWFLSMFFLVLLGSLHALHVFAGFSQCSWWFVGVIYPKVFHEHLDHFSKLLYSNLVRFEPVFLSGNLQDDPSDGGSSDGPAYPLAQQQQQLQQRRVQGDRGGRRPSRVSSQLRSRMCRSMGADLDQLLQEEEESGRGHEAARLGRLALLSSSLSLGRHLSSSSLSSCHSLGELADEGPQGRRSFPPDSFTSSSPAHREHTSKQVGS